MSYSLLSFSAQLLFYLLATCQHIYILSTWEFAEQYLVCSTSEHKSCYLYSTPEHVLFLFIYYYSGAQHMFYIHATWQHICIYAIYIYAYIYIYDNIYMTTYIYVICIMTTYIHNINIYIMHVGNCGTISGLVAPWSMSAIVFQSSGAEKEISDLLK